MSVSHGGLIVAELRRRYLQNSAASRGFRRIRNARTPTAVQRLDDLLRHHTVRGIQADETWWRDEVDEFLYYVSILEAACSAAVIRIDDIPDRHKSEIADALECSPVRAWYIRRYPLLLPRLFNSRVRSSSGYVSRSGHGKAWFSTLLSVSAYVEVDPELETFLWLLDGGVRYDGIEDDYIDIHDTVNALGDPEEFASLLKRNRGVYANSVQGFGRFLEFCEQLDNLLQNMRSAKQLRDVFWHVHAYWFLRLASRAGHTVNKGIDNILRITARKVEDSARPAGAKALERVMHRRSRDLKAAVRRLTRKERVQGTLYGANADPRD